MTVDCPFCAEPIRSEAVKCKHCGEWLDERALAKEEKPAGKTTVIVQQSQALPALASFFIPGLGQLIQGRVLMAVVLFIAAVLGWSVIVCGWIVHVAAAIEATTHKPKLSQ